MISFYHKYTKKKQKKTKKHTVRIKFKENRRDNQQWTSQRNWKHWVQETGRRQTK